MDRFARGNQMPEHHGISNSRRNLLLTMLPRFKQAANRLWRRYRRARISDDAVRMLLIAHRVSGAKRGRLRSRLGLDIWKTMQIQGCYSPDSHFLADNEWERSRPMAPHIFADHWGGFLSHRCAWMKVLRRLYSLQACP